MTKVKQMASLTIMEYEDGTREAIIMSHPNGNIIEEMMVSIVELTNALIKDQAEKQKGAEE